MNTPHDQQPQITTFQLILIVVILAAISASLVELYDSTNDTPPQDTRVEAPK